ncbi:MAG: imidazole glycerol phosphate synthase subunit HisH [Selenomonadaceae bacterium]|nr:imidazole glycerol phosphate synthase subunit HisH [Selenomonadaceae bacterium]
MIVLIDYGVGNLYSVAKAVASVGGDVKISGAIEDVKNAEKIILPGVGAFGDCMKNLEATGLIPTIKEEIAAGKKIFGICVGLQILFEGSEESPNVEGLKIFSGRVKKIRADGLKIPHMGWNSISFGDSKLFTGLNTSPYFYFVHSYHAAPVDENIITATTVYGETITAAVERDNIFATQFHPEKSGDVGLRVLQNFVSM